MTRIPIHIISLGAGVQSSCIALMATLGLILPSPFGAIFADTQAEPKNVYTWLDWLELQLGFFVYRVTRGNLGEESLKIYTSAKSGLRYIKTLIPAFTLQPDGKKGLLGRKCTKNYKVDEIINEIKRVVGSEKIIAWRRDHKAALKQLSLWRAEYAKIKKENKLLDRKSKLPLPLRPDAAWSECQADPLVVSWIGISTDEAHRMKDSQEPWIVNRYPLIEMGMSREDCLKWMLDHGYPEPPRSACKWCPFHSDDEWIRLRDEEPEEFEEAVQFERRLQTSAANQEALTGVPYLHVSCVPIDQVKFNPTKPGKQQVSMFGNECEGLCGV